MMDDKAEKRYKRGKKRHPRSKRNVLYSNPGGVAAIWADENTRPPLFDAMPRREVYATSGTRIRVKTLASWGESDKANGVPMGGDLINSKEGASPSFYVMAERDPNSANLDRIQMIGGWFENGEKHELVVDIACTGGIAPDAETKLCPEAAMTVDLTSCEIDNEQGSLQIETVWQDPAFNPDQFAFYYVRVFENPVCRWSSHDALLLARELKPQVDAVIQERPWSSPTWFSPTRLVYGGRTLARCVF